MAEYYDPDTYPQEWNYLQPCTIIDHYMIERELAHGGFSSVYLARQLSDQIQVAIKEYLPRKLSHRTWNNAVIAHDDASKALFLRGRALFFEEAKVLVKLKHPNIVEVTNFFQANSTVYMVMTYDYGITLDRILKEKLFTLNESIILTIFKRLLTGIELIHANNFLHLDIKPANILIRPGFDPLLLDFGAIQQYPPVPKQLHTRVCTQGFSPVEQYAAQGRLGPWTDIYAIGASIRACMDYKIPIAASDRAKQDTLKPTIKAHKNKFSDALLEMVDWAMQIQPENRPQSIAELQSAINWDL